MSQIVQNVIISTLKGESGADKKIHSCYPEESGIYDHKLLEFTLPTGAQKGKIFEFNYQGKDLLVYISELENSETRNDVVSISFLLSEDAEKESVLSVLKALFSEIKVEKFEDMGDLTGIANGFCKSLNQQVNFQLHEYFFDLHNYLRKNKVKLRKQARRVHGTLF